MQLHQQTDRPLHQRPAAHPRQKTVRAAGKDQKTGNENGKRAGKDRKQQIQLAYPLEMQGRPGEQRDEQADQAGQALHEDRAGDGRPARRPERARRQCHADEVAADIGGHEIARELAEEIEAPKRSPRQGMSVSLEQKPPLPHAEGQCRWREEMGEQEPFQFRAPQAVIQLLQVETGDEPSDQAETDEITQERLDPGTGHLAHRSRQIILI